MRETWVRSLGGEDPLEKGKATHSSILAWRIPWMESQRVGHGWATFTSQGRVGFPGDSAVKNLPAVQETQIWSLGRKDPLEKGNATHSSILAWRISVDRGAWWATAHRVTKRQTRPSNSTTTCWRSWRQFALPAHYLLSRHPTSSPPLRLPPPGVVAAS